MPTDRRDLQRKLFGLVSAQGGYFTAAQAKEVGYSYQAQAYHVRAGNWLRVDRGLFRLTPWNPDIHDDLIRWTLWSRGMAVISHETALVVHDIGELESPRTHLTVPPHFSRRDAAVTLHWTDLPESDVIQRTGFRVTNATRSLIDVAGSADEDQLARAIEDGRDRGLFTLRRLREHAEATDLKAALRIERALQLPAQ